MRDMQLVCKVLKPVKVHPDYFIFINHCIVDKVPESEKRPINSKSSLPLTGLPSIKPGKGLTVGGVNH